MYVAELDRPWRETPFMFQGFEIHSDEQLTKLRELCRYVFVQEADAPIDPARSGTVSAPQGRTRMRVIGGTTLTGSTRTVAQTPNTRYADSATVEQELSAARSIEREARNLVFTIMDDIRAGKRIDAPGARKAVQSMTDSVIRNPDALVWLTHLKKKHEYTVTHSLRVSILALAFGRHLDYPRDKLELLGLGALLHDIGKLKVPNEILDKPARLTDEEFVIMRQHVPLGVELLRATPDVPQAAVEVARCHHERFNGVGYINGLKGEEIGEFGLIGAIVDSYDAITSDRAYHGGLSPADALKILYDEKNTAFHAGFVEQFIQCVGIYPIGSIVELSDHSIGVVTTVNRGRRLKPQLAVILDPRHQPLPRPQALDLVNNPRTTTGLPLDIRAVLPAGSYGIDPTRYIPGSY